MNNQKKIIFLSAAFFTLLSCHKKNDAPGPSAPSSSLSITTINPTTGGKNTALTITGTNFSTVTNENEVFINGVAATVTAATATSLTVTVPGMAGTGLVTIKRGNQSASGPKFNYTFNYYQVTTLAGSTQGSADGKGNQAQFNLPWGLAVDNKGNIFVADTYNDKIRMISPDGTVITLAGSGLPAYSNGQSNFSQFKYPFGIAVDNNTGIIYVADAGNNAIRMLTPGGLVGYTTSTLAGSGEPNNLPSPGPGFLNGTGTSARFNFPTGVSVDTIGNLYVADKINNSIRKIALQNASVTTVNGGTGTAGYVDGPSANALFHNPTGLVADPGGKYLLIVDTYNNSVREVANLASGSPIVVTLAGSTAGTGGSLDGDNLKAQFSGLTSIALDVAHGDEIVADYSNNSIRLIDVATSKVRTLAGSKDHPGSTDGPLATATFNWPSGVAVDAAGNIYVADSQNHRIRKIAYE